MISDICPEAGRRAMYGGIVFELVPEKHATMVCGHFVYKHHVGLEFSRGYLLDDPEGVLSGSGKYRRHIKLRSLEDLDNYPVRTLIEQAFRNEKTRA